jgi:hypothetical protein
MRCEPWMNRAPSNPPTPRQMAEADLRHWQAEHRNAQERLLECDRRISEARDRLAKLD